jgi:thioesterase domain-containing protein/acyl carrier protein
VPYYHGMGIGPPLLTVLLAGGTVICTRDFIPSDFLSLLKEFRPTYYAAGPALHLGILREIKKVSPDELKNNSLRFIRSGSAALPPHARLELEALLGVVMVEAFAMSEAGEISVNIPQKPGSVGIPVIEDLKILNENGEGLPHYKQGEIVVKGETVFAGYEDNPDENRAAFTDGWFKTGDMGYLDDEGYLFYTGRKKELINKGGEKISPAEIDAVFMTHPSVKQAMAFRITDPVLGEDIAAMVVLENQDVTKEGLHRYLIDRLVQFKMPQRIYVVDEIPKGPTGKLLRYVGTERYSGIQQKDVRVPGYTGDTITPEESQIQEKIMQIWKDILDTGTPLPDDNFFLCGGNSLTAIELLIRIQRIFHINFPADTIYRYPTIRDQAGLVSRRANTGASYHQLIVPVRENGTNPPLFCFHEIGGWIGQYQAISPFLDQNRPVFGIRARGLEPAEKPCLTIEEAVLEYYDAIKTVQKEGPYHLLGFSAGATYAFELACQLQKRGEIIPYLGIIDASAPSPQRKLFNLTKGQGSGSVMANVYHLYHFLRKRLKTDGIFYSLFVRLVSVFSRGLLYLKDANLLSVTSQDSDTIFGGEKDEWILSTFPPEQQPLVRSLRTAMNNYHPGIFSGDITLFSTGPDVEFFPGDMARGWNAFITGRTVVENIPGNHVTLFHEPNSRVVAQKIEESLKRADAGG